MSEIINNKEILEIEVNNPIIFNNMKSQTNNDALNFQNKFTTAELKKMLKEREEAQIIDRQAYKDLIDEVVPSAIFKLACVSEQLSVAKKEVFQFFEQALELKAKVYGIKEKQMSHTFSTKNCEVTIGYRVTDAWDDTVTAGVAKVQKFISSLAKDDSTAALVELVFNLLKKDAKGNLKSSRVLELQKLTSKFNDDNFTDGVKIIAEAYKPNRSVWFIDASLIHPSGEKTSIPLSISAVDFAEGYNFDFFNDKTETDEHQN